MLGILKPEEIEEVLMNGSVGRIGCCTNGKTYIVPINYIYDGKQIIAHSTEGEKIYLMRNNPLVCFEVEEIKDNCNWKTVISWGTYHEITDERERYDAMKLFVDHMLRLKISTTAHPPEMKPERHSTIKQSVRPVIYHILLSEKTGRFEKESET
jgi:nitroimidazol reductase NimA-like FMN-containing flavoprotein (pyridoxamine 5'-phosphate oxidase superfamily)